MLEQLAQREVPALRHRSSNAIDANREVIGVAVERQSHACLVFTAMGVGEDPSGRGKGRWVS